MRFAAGNRDTLLGLLLLVIAFTSAPGVTAIGAQSAVGKSPAFEVASIKWHDPNDPNTPRFGSALYGAGGRFTATNMTLIQIVRLAHNLRPNLVSGGPSWVTSENDRYDIEAVAEQGTFPSGQPDRAMVEKMRSMLQRLLAERFSLMVKIEDREEPIYALVVAKGGPKLQKSQRDCDAAPFTCHGYVGGTGRGLEFWGTDMTDLAESLSGLVDRPVHDKTGISGMFDFKLPPWTNPTRPQTESFGTGTEPVPDPNRPDLFGVLQDSIGLRLVTDKGPVRHLVIESASRPSTN